NESKLQAIFKGTAEVSSAVLTAILTTLISFLPVFAMTGAEGKMFTPLAYTKTFVLIASVILALTVIPVLLVLLNNVRVEKAWISKSLFLGLAGASAFCFIFVIVFS